MRNDLLCQKISGISSNRIYPFILILAVFEECLRKLGFQNKTVFFEHPLRSLVTAESTGKQPVNLEVFKRKRDYLFDGTRNDAFAPMGFSQPVAQFCVFALYIVLWVYAYAPHRFALPFHRKDMHGLVLVGKSYKVPAALLRIGVRELVGHKLGDMGVVGIAHQTAQILRSPRS